ncbi:MAG TPA: cation:proton antiporter [Symbiobacteriaceae bacterium]|nr:cation:proton antiporter [Symbiobacteriaceae bacterium]
MNHIIFEIGLALAVIAGAGLLSAKLRFSVVPLLVLAGMAVGPHAPKLGMIDFRFLESAPLIEFMGRVGVLFLLFYLGLEFSVGRLIKAGKSILRAGTIYMVINFPLGILLGLLLGWPMKETLVTAGMVAISSSAIVAKLIVELKRSAHSETETVLGIMMFQDVFVAVYLAVVSGWVLSGSASVTEVLRVVGVAVAFMLGFILIGRKMVPWLNRVLQIASDEVFLLVICSGLLLVSGFSESIHVAEAIGALLFGLVLAETDHRYRIEHMVLPFRDFFGAIFFFHFGLTIDPLALGGAIWPALAAVVLTVAGNLGTGLVVGPTAGLSRKASTYLGLSLTPRGEFSILLANMAKSGALLGALQPFAALYVLSLAVLGPFLTKEAKHVYGFMSKVMHWEKPKPRPGVG